MRGFKSAAASGDNISLSRSSRTSSKPWGRKDQRNKNGLFYFMRMNKVHRAQAYPPPPEEELKVTTTTDA